MTDNNILKFKLPKKPPAEEIMRLKPGRIYRLTYPGMADIVIDYEWVKIGERALSRKPTDLVS